MGEENLEVEQIDVAAYVAASVFNVVALPPGMPDFMKLAIEVQAERERQLPGPGNMDITAGETKEDRDKKAAERASDQISQIAQQQQQERQEWAQSQHGFGTTMMTGVEWSKLADDLGSDGELRQWLLARVMQDGKTEAEAKVIADKVARVAKAMAKPESQRTPDEKKDLVDASKDATISKYVEQAAQYQQKTGPDVERDTVAAHGSTMTSAAAGDDQLRAFASAPDLTRHHQAAMAALAPLDAPMSQAQATAPPSPQLAASGFEI